MRVLKVSPQLRYQHALCDVGRRKRLMRKPSKTAALREIDEDEEQWVQFRIHRAGDVLLTRYWTGDRWSRADRSAALSAERIGAPARLVPLADADAPPESRGPIQPAKDGARVVKVETDGPGLRPGTRVDGGAK